MLPVTQNPKNKTHNKGIENAISPTVFSSEWYSIKTKTIDYGGENTIKEFKKVFACEEICKLPNDILFDAFEHLKPILESSMDFLFPE